MWSHWLRPVFSNHWEGSWCALPLALLQRKAKWLTTQVPHYTSQYHTSKTASTALFSTKKSDTESKTFNCQDNYANNGGPQRHRISIPDSPLILRGSDDAPPIPSIKENSFTSKFVYIKCPCIKTCLCAVQRSAISLGQYTFRFLCSFHWHFVKFLTGRGLLTALKTWEKGRLSLYGIPLEKMYYRQDN